MKYVSLFLLLSFLFVCPGFTSPPEDENQESMSDILFNMDYGRFRYDSSSVYLEVYYSVIPNKENIKKTPPLTKLNFELTSGENDSVLAEHQIEIDKQELMGVDKSNGSLGILKLVVPIGDYQMRMFNSYDTVTQKTSVSTFHDDRITMSDLELCSNIITRSSETDNPFYKNTMKVFPNPTNIFGKALPRLYYYLEIYNLKRSGGNQEDSIFIQAVVSDRDGNIRMQREYYRQQNVGSLVERGAFNIQGLETGLYTLIFAVSDSSENQAVYRRRNFYVQNPDVVLAEAQGTARTYSESEFSNMPENKLDKMFNQARYLAQKSEKDVYEVLNTVESKRQFLYKFWKARNEEKPGWKDTYYSRVEYANEHYRSGGTEGWKTDMGRVYILYGPPDEYERAPVGPNENPYEIWHYYEIEGGVEFDFVDLSGFGVYRLVNSTKRGEITYPQWREYIYKR